MPSPDTLLQELPPDVAKMVALSAGQPDAASRILKLADMLKARRKDSRQLAERLALYAWSLAPADEAIRTGTQWAIAGTIGHWHFPMTHEPQRLEAFDAALREVITPDSVVYDLGAGTAILALIAARAGARHVYACERDPYIAAAAVDIVARNGLADKVTIIAKSSDQVVIGEDMPEPADVMVSDLVQYDVVGYGILRAVEDARERLLKPDAPVIPSRVDVKGALVGGSDWKAYCRLGEHYGFDLSDFNRFAPVRASIRCDLGMEQALSDDYGLMSFDFQHAAKHQPQHRRLQVTASGDGEVEGMAVWVDMQYRPGIHLENRPPAEGMIWRRPQFYVFPRAIPVTRGQTLDLDISHDRAELRITPV